MSSGLNFRYMYIPTCTISTISYKACHHTQLQASTLTNSTSNQLAVYVRAHICPLFLLIVCNYFSIFTSFLQFEFFIKLCKFSLLLNT